MSVLVQPLPPNVRHRIVIGTSIRKPAAVLRAYLQTVVWQEWPKGVEPSYCFVLDTEDPDAMQVMEQFALEHEAEGVKLLRPGVGPRDTDDTHPETHQWSPTGMARVGQNKNLILKHAVDIQAAAVWLVDADLLVDRTTFASLWSQRVAIACAVYWTHWHNPATQAGTLHAAPQVWLCHPYQLEGRGWDAAEFRRNLVTRQRTKVFGQGACTLIRREAIEKGVSFDYIPGVPTEGLMGGEDRHFCLRAEGLHLPMVADPWPDIFHVYHPQDHELIPEMLERLGVEHQETPGFGDWVSVLLEPLEPVVTQPGQAQALPPLWYRGRFGTGALMPELEERIATMKRGETSTLGVHFPIHHPAAFLRGHRRLLRVTLQDCKPWAFAPVLEQELLRGSTGAIADRVTLSRDQQQAIQEDQAVYDR